VVRCIGEKPERHRVGGNALVSRAERAPRHAFFAMVDRIRRQRLRHADPLGSRNKNNLED